jgi:ribosomal protein L33
MAYRVTKKAVVITIKILITKHKAKLWITKINPEINSQRIAYKKFDELKDNFIITKF